MRYIPIIIFTLFFSSCFDKNLDFEKEYYERITGIKFPDKYKVLDAFDNGEFLTGAVFQFDSITMKNFIIQNNFDTLKDLDFHFINIGLFDKKFQPKRTTNSFFFIIWKSKEKNNWTYLADLNTNRLWTEISYPDWGGQ